MNICTSARELEWLLLETEEDCEAWGIDPMGVIGLIAVRDPGLPGSPVQAIIPQEQFDVQYATIP